MHVTLPMRAADTTERRGTTYFSGKVRSSKARCERRRDVTLYFKVEGPLQAIGTDVTDAEGRWSIKVLAFVPGRYHARAAKRRIGQGASAKLCRGARSEPYDRKDPF